MLTLQYHVVSMRRVLVIAILNNCLGTAESAVEAEAGGFQMEVDGGYLTKLVVTSRWDQIIQD